MKDGVDEESSNAGLSNGYRQLVEAGLNLYNNYQEFPLYLSLGTWGKELFEVFVQACKIRREERVHILSNHDNPINLGAYNYGTN
jgi:hypothetical protein